MTGRRDGTTSFRLLDCAPGDGASERGRQSPPNRFRSLQCLQPPPKFGQLRARYQNKVELLDHDAGKFQIIFLLENLRQRTVYPFGVEV